MSSLAWILIGAYVALPIQVEPVYDGKPLRYWVQAVQSDDETVRKKARDALVEIGRPAALALMADLDDGVTRAHALVALSQIGPPAEPATDRLIALLKDKSLGTVASIALGHIGPGARSALPALEAQLTEKGRGPFFFAYAMVQIDPASATAAIPVLTDVVATGGANRAYAAFALGLSGEGAARAVPALTEMLSDPEELPRSAAAHALGRIGPAARPSIRALTKAIEDRSREVRIMAAYALARIDPSTRPLSLAVLRRSLQSEIDANGIFPVDLLRAPGSLATTFIPVLAEALSESDIPFRVRAAGTIAWLNSTAGTPAVPTFIEALQGRESGLRLPAAFALWNIGPAAVDAVPALTRFVDDKDERLRDMARKALKQIRRVDLAGCSIAELSIKAIYPGPYGFEAVARKDDQRLYRIRAGDRVMDGVAAEVTRNGVTFRREAAQADFTVTFTTVQERLFADDERPSALPENLSRPADSSSTESPATFPLTVNWKNENLLNVLRTIALVSGLNIVVDPNVSGWISLRVEDEPWDRVATYVLETQGLDYREDANFLRIGRKGGIGEDRRDNSTCDADIVSFDFMEADLPNLTAALHELTGLEFVADPGVKLKTTVHATDVCWDKAFEVMLRSNGLRYTREGKVVRVWAAQ